MVVFSELESLVQMARYATEKLPQYRETNRTNKNPPDTVTPEELGDNIDSTPEADGEKNAVLHTQGVVATINSGKMRHCQRRKQHYQTHPNKPREYHPQQRHYRPYEIE